jgi:hypothetical protein
MHIYIYRSINFEGLEAVIVQNIAM